MERKTVNISISNIIEQSLRTISKEKGISVSELINQILAQSLAEEFTGKINEAQVKYGHSTKKLSISMELENNDKSRALIRFLLENGYELIIDPVMNEEDWAVSGRVANKKEIEILAESMETEKEGGEIDDVFDRLINKLKE